MVGRLIELVEHCSFLDFRVDDQYFFPYLITRFRLLTLFWMLRLVLVDLFYYRNGIVYTSGMAEKSELFDLQAEKADMLR